MKTRADTIIAIEDILKRISSDKPGPHGSPTLESYMESMASWIEDSEKRGKELSWEFVVDMLYAGLIYD